MPYSTAHKAQTRAKILETARVLFNQLGYQKVTIDRVMAEAGLTRGGFYNHFKNKESLFSEAVSSFLMGQGARWREEAGLDLENLKPEMAQQMIDAYLSQKHLGDLEGQCPMIALPSDVARADKGAQESFQQLLNAMVWLFEVNMADDVNDKKQEAHAIAALCIGGMVLAKALPDSTLAEDVRSAAHLAASGIFQSKIKGS